MPDPGKIGVRVRREGRLGRILLDRPRALNALTLPMVQTIGQTLERWRTAPLRAIVIESATPGMFCAGGDIRAIRQNGLDGDPAASDAFFDAEYRVNETLAAYPVPVVALIDGVCFGGGMGLSVHGPIRIVTERAVMAMPETAIGFFPDVGASYFLSHLPGGIGVYLGLTGTRLGAADALQLGLATHHIPSSDLASVRSALDRDTRPIADVLQDLTSAPSGPKVTATVRGRIDAAFAAPTVDGILERLRTDPDPWGSETLATLEAASPQSLRLTLDLIRQGRHRTLAECLEAERAAARQVVGSADFLEGVRAALVDRDRTPVWSHPAYEGTSPDGRMRWAATPRAAAAGRRTEQV